MLIVTTPTIEGKKIAQHLGPVFGQCIVGAGSLKSFISGVKDVLGARVIVLEDEVRHARDMAVRDMIRDAEKLGAQAVVGLCASYDSLAEGQLMLVAVAGTAVIVEA
ncbi:MAG: YbjQ family protein [Deltaproteobacteria bacterium]|nr:YbjQ family protein [Candidatus Zymogenaceae bacterium]